MDSRGTVDILFNPRTQSLIKSCTLFQNPKIPKKSQNYKKKSRKSKETENFLNSQFQKS